MTATEALAAWASRLRLSDVPDRVVAMAKSQILSQLAAVRAGSQHPLGQALRRAFGPPLQPDPRQSACVLAGLGSWLNLDDTAYAGHLGNSTVGVPLAYAHARGLDGAELLTAVIAANECAARITASATLGPLRGQSAVHTHLAGAVSGRLRAEAAPAACWVDALGLAFSFPPWPLLRGFLGSDAKVFNAFTPVRMAMDACDGAAAGLAGAPDILEHRDGFLARHATVALPEAASAGLGRRWHTETLSFKVRPGGPGIDAAVDCAIEISRLLPGLSTEEIAEVVVEASIYTLFVGAATAEHLDGPRTPISSLLLDVPYTVATALLTGDLTTADFAVPALRDPRRWALTEKVRLVHDPLMTRALFTSEAPFGEAIRQAGSRAVDWIRSFGGPRMAGAVAEAGLENLAGTAGEPVDTFEHATKVTAAQLTVRLTDGRRFVRRRDIPIGGIGPETRAHHPALARAKFLAHGGPEEVAEAFEKLELLSASRLAQLLEAALDAATIGRRSS